MPLPLRHRLTAVGDVSTGWHRHSGRPAARRGPAAVDAAVRQVGTTRHVPVDSLRDGCGPAVGVARTAARHLPTPVCTACGRRKSGPCGLGRPRCVALRVLGAGRIATPPAPPRRGRRRTAGGAVRRASWMTSECRARPDARRRPAARRVADGRLGHHRHEHRPPRRSAHGDHADRGEAEEMLARTRAAPRSARPGGCPAQEEAPGRLTRDGSTALGTPGMRSAGEPPLTSSGDLRSVLSVHDRHIRTTSPRRRPGP